MKTQVFSWRVSSGLKSELEREARLRKTTVTALLEEAARACLVDSGEGPDDAERQLEIRQAAERCFGTIELPCGDASERVSELVREKMSRRCAR
ncbi:MAG: hypothetical protein JWN34_1033 [Bryobacterales bacterium]|jgi:hypothetical protein|nr:hypothetical protein [Bryobacterales bacterium]